MTHDEPVHPGRGAPPNEGAPCATTPELIARAAETMGHTDLLIFGDERLTYAQLDDRSRALAGRLLTEGVSAGSRVGILFPNSPEWVVAFFAVTRIGAVAVPVNTFSRPRELAQLLRHAEVRMLLATSSFLGHDYVTRLEEALPSLTGQTDGRLLLPEAPQLRSIWIEGDRAGRAWAGDLGADPDGVSADADTGEIAGRLVDEAGADISPADLLVIVYTSGSTAAPKGVMHTHGSIVRHADHLRHRTDYRRGDRIYATMPFFWVGGLTVTLIGAMHAGATILGETRIDGERTLAFLERERATIVSGWPEAFSALADLPTFGEFDLSAVRRGTLYAALPAEIRPTDPLLRQNSLGMTETGGPHTYSDDLDHDLPEHLRGAFGTPLPGITHRIADPDTGAEVSEGEVGEIWVRGPYLTVGLVKQERHETFTEDGWYRTGDMGSWREGYLFFAGRRGDMIKAHGANVSPREVEAVLLELPGVRAAHVVGVPGGYGEEVAAVLVANAGATLDPDAVVAAAKQELSSYKVPRIVRVMAEHEIPMLTTGKVDRRALIALLGN